MTVIVDRLGELKAVILLNLTAWSVGIEMVKSDPEGTGLTVVKHISRSIGRLIVGLDLVELTLFNWL